MAKQHLNLFKLAASRPAQLRAGPSQVMRRDARNTDCFRVRLEHLPDDLLAQVFACHSVGPVFFGWLFYGPFRKEECFLKSIGCSRK